MPLVDDAPADTVLRTPTTAPEPNPFQPGPSAWDTLGAAFRQENTISNVVSLMNRPVFAPEPGYNPIEAIRGTKYERDHLDDALSIRSSAEMRDWQGRIDQEEADKRVLHDAGGWGIASGILAGVLDPLMFLPVGGAVKSVRGGYDVVKSAAAVGGLTALQTGVSEIALQANQATRTGAESAIAIATSGVLGGLIGGGAAALLSRAERQAMEGLFDQDRKLVSEIVEGSSAQPTSAGAAATDVRQLKLVGYGLDKVPGLNSLIERMSPTLRVFSSDNVAAKRAMADLAETALRFEDNARGISTSFGGAPVSRLVQAQKLGMQLEAAETLKDAFTAYRFGDAVPSAAMARAAIDDLRGVVEDGKLAFNDFKREVTNALFSGDVHAIPQVEQAAKSIRTNILEPIREKAIALGLLDPDAAPKGDPSWFARVWNREKLSERRPDAVKRFADWLEGEQTRKAAAQERLSAASDELDAVDATRGRLDAQIQRLEATTQKLEGRIAERALEARRSGDRATTLAERKALLDEEQADIEETIAGLKADVRDPALRERIDRFEKNYRAVRRQEENARVTDADLERIDREEAEAALSDTIGALAADMVIGKRRSAREPSFAHYLARNGGIKDAGGDARYVVGSTRSHPGLLSNSGRTLDEWGEKLMEDFRLPERPTERQVLDWLDEAMRGRQPGFWLESFSGQQRAALDATRFAASLDEAMSRAGFTPKSREDVAKFLTGEEAPDRTLADLDRTLEEMGREAIPPSVKLEGVEGNLTLAKEDLEAARSALQRGFGARQQAAVRSRILSGRQAEAGMADRASRGRIGILQDRQAQAVTRRELLDEAIRLQDAAEAEIMKRIEQELGEWGGRSANEALTAIKARDKAMDGRAPDAPRLTGADRPMMKAVARILDSDRNLSRAELDARANEIVDRILGTPDGRLPYDAASGGPKNMATPETGEMRGSLRSRDFAIPTALVRDLIEDDAEHILSTVTRTMLPDMALVERFGDVDMTEAMKKIVEESAAKAARTTNAKELKAIEAEKQALLRDVAATRDRIRGTFGFSQDATGRNIARYAQVAKNFNVITDLGTAALNSMGDAAGVVFRHGFVNTFRDGWAPFFQRMLSTAPAGEAEKRQLRTMLLAVETQTNLRGHSIADVAENYRPGTRFERAVRWAADKSQIVNGQTFWTDWTKGIAATVGSAEMLRAAERVALGKGTAKDIANLGESSIDEAMARRIHAAYADGGGAKVDGSRLPNTDAWKDRGAARAFEAALQREVDITVLTPGLEKPLWMSSPVMSMLGQFKAFIAAANERMLIANLQRSDWNTLQGLFAAVTLGMLSYRLYTLVSGQKASERPQDWVKEGISRSGVMGWFDEINSMGAKFTRGQSDMYRLIGADKPLSRMQSRGILGAFAGPTAGKVERLAQIGGSAASGEWNASDTTAVRRLLPFQNLFMIRRLLDEVEKGVNQQFGVPQATLRN